MKSINNDMETTLLRLEENLMETSPHIERYQKRLLFIAIKEKHIEQYAAHQRRIKALRSPISTAIGAFQRFFGGENDDPVEHEIDTSILEEDFEATKKILDSLDLKQSINFFHESMKYGLNRANSKWIKEVEGELDQL